MSVAKPLIGMSIAQYLELERNGQVRHEYLDGEIYAMSGASRRHNLIANNLNTLIRSHLQQGPCEVYIADVKVYIEALNVFYYPDIVVACDPQDDNDYFVTRPVLAVEVESPSTSITDRREKLIAYRKLESLREYLLLSQDMISADVFRRDGKGEWVHERLISGDQLRLDSVDLLLPLIQVYDGIDLPQEK